MTGEEKKERHHLSGVKAIMAYLGVSRRGFQKRIKRGLPVYWEGNLRWAITTELDEWRRLNPTRQRKRFRGEGKLTIQSCTPGGELREE